MAGVSGEDIGRLRTVGRRHRAAVETEYGDPLEQIEDYPSQGQAIPNEARPIRAQRPEL